jgi:hypothetical protein
MEILARAQSVEPSMDFEWSMTTAQKSGAGRVGSSDLLLKVKNLKWNKERLSRHGTGLLRTFWRTPKRSQLRRQRDN